MSRPFDHGKQAYGEEHRAYAGQQARHILGDNLMVRMLFVIFSSAALLDALLDALPHLITISNTTASTPTTITNGHSQTIIWATASPTAETVA
jgi:hypothetical protein